MSNRLREREGANDGQEKQCIDLRERVYVCV